MIKEFKDFIMRGNVLELAVAVLIAGAFGAVITAFTDGIISPIIGMALGGVDFSEIKQVLVAGVPAVMDGATVVKPAIEEVSLKWGEWINTIVNFLIVAFILFMIVKAYNKATPKEEEAPAPPAGPSEIDLLKDIKELLKK